MSCALCLDLDLADYCGTCGRSVSHRAGKTQPVAVAVERVGSGVLGTWYSVTVELASHAYHVRIAAAGRARFILGARTASGNLCRSQHRAMVEQAAREAVLT